MQKSILWVLAVIIIAGGWYLFTANPKETSESAEGVTEQAEPVSENVQESAAGQANDAAAGAVNTPVAAKVPDAVITYTDAGFAPSSVAIKKGQTVRWVNNSGEKMWPASAVHPSHSVYPQKSATDCLGSSFDTCKGLSQGESWDFTFDYAGEWKFHNHLKASQTGAVNVTE